ncbi:PREDICTED: UPF0449 protein C19orf25 homolog [Ceratosolen solmsi marchali]|uniref:UPF0449 protein C19orf25 homolog n=1 Tax=Ceratosolen solmsi marchali TaxID=326594 RepID=A0AAJ6YEC2_9HYME|nr:PREDICTED: UPF0449 protein C19orf25 homolog [Ceratosolen solmsi marchali]
MFGNKKKYTLPERPKPPNMKEIVEDLKNSKDNNDIAFTLLTHESGYNDSFLSSEPTDINNTYEKIKTYVDINKKLKTLKESIHEAEEDLKSNVNDIVVLTEEIKEQAQAALIQ